MIYQLAPLEGITTYIFRNAYAKYYGEISEYFTPFISPHKDKTLNSKERNEVIPDNNKGINLIPQILTNSSIDFINTVNDLQAYGYTHVNLNFGCPSPTVTTKKKGSGILTDLYLLETFLDDIFNNTNIDISIKTRIGYSSYDEWDKIYEIYKQYPVKELIVHPRIREDFYKNKPNVDIFSNIYNDYSGKLVLNGNVFSPDDLKAVQNRFPDLYAVMMGRGLIACPNLINSHIHNKSENVKTLKSFHDEIYTGYKETQNGDRNVLFRMKELWFYLARSFDAMPKLEKQLKKSQSCQEYEVIINQIFNNVPLNENSNIIF